MTNVEDATQDLGTKVCEQVTADSSQVKQKQQEICNLKDTQGLVLATETFQNLGLDKLQGSRNLLPNQRLTDARLKDQKMAECILLCNKLTETVLGEIDISSLKRPISSTTENLKVNNKSTDKNIKKDLGLIEAGPTDHLDKMVLTKALVNAQPSSRGHFFCFQYMEEFGFLMIPDFLMLSVSFLFLAYGCSAPIVYMVPYALSVGVEHQHAAFLMSIFGVSGIVGNITFGWITDRE